MNHKTTTSSGAALQGIITAIGIIAAWAGVLLLGFSLHIHGPWELFASAPVIALQTFLNTGLFITAHDAMHGTLAPTNRRLNDALGRLSVILYALFSYDALRKEHKRHHAHPGSVVHDPDFHGEAGPGFIRWYVRFMMHYLKPYQILGMALVFNILVYVGQVPLLNAVLFWVTPALASTVQLFFFGTYLPHRRSDSLDDPHHARSSSFPVWLSFLTCYHFGYHREHHEHPYLPWWRLPKARWGGS